jgi:hypothetical protein
MHSEPATQPFARSVIFLIAVTAVLSASATYWYSKATRRANEAAIDAAKHQVEGRWDEPANSWSWGPVPSP